MVIARLDRRNPVLWHAFHLCNPTCVVDRQHYRANFHDDLVSEHSVAGQSLRHGSRPAVIKCSAWISAGLRAVLGYPYGPVLPCKRMHGKCFCAYIQVQRGINPAVYDPQRSGWGNTRALEPRCAENNRAVPHRSRRSLESARQRKPASSNPICTNNCTAARRASDANRQLSASLVGAWIRGTLSINTCLQA